MRALTAFLLVSLGACATPGHTRLTLAPESILQGPRELVIAGERTVVVVALEEALRSRRFRVKRYTSVSEVSVATGAQTETSRVGATRYVLELHADVADRCFGGGFRFNSLRADLIDLSSNEIVLSSKAKGYSEGCQPMSGTIFGDLARQLEAAWVEP